MASTIVRSDKNCDQHIDYHEFDPKWSCIGSGTIFNQFDLAQN